MKNIHIYSIGENIIIIKYKIIEKFLIFIVFILLEENQCSSKFFQ